MTIEQAMDKVGKMRTLGHWVAYLDELRDNNRQPNGEEVVWVRHLGDAQWYYPFECEWAECKQWILETLHHYKQKQS